MHSSRRIKGVVLDKDGTLLDFHATWDATFGTVLAEFADADADLTAVLDRELGFDRDAGRILDDSPFVADSSAQFADKLAVLIGRPVGDAALVDEIDESITRYMPAVPTPEDGAGELLDALRARGIPMAVATNDNAERAAIQMAQLGWREHFTAIYGVESGHGEKPAPGMVVAAAAAMGLDPSDVAMVGDSSTDTGAGAAAGAITVLYGGRADLVDVADIVIGPLHELLDHLA
ncbi:MAG: HAD-IA family hydrolase [Acidimicrobiales bacterium]|nr:HAD-IA family hydrolase [Acidimicrobiales bacterium]